MILSVFPHTPTMTVCLQNDLCTTFTSRLKKLSLSRPRETVPNVTLIRVMFGLWEWSCWRQGSFSIRTSAIEMNGQECIGKPFSSISVDSGRYTPKSSAICWRSCSQGKRQSDPTGSSFRGELRRQKAAYLDLALRTLRSRRYFSKSSTRTLPKH